MNDSHEISPTQKLSDSDAFDEPPESNSWGRLLALPPKLASVDLENDTYTVGRGPDNDVVLLPIHPSFQAMSKVHFKLTRETSPNGTFTYIHDMSSNGTFINGQKIGKNKKQPLNNNDEISLAIKTCKYFVFINLCDDSEKWPATITEKYIVSKLLGRGACGVVRLIFLKGNCERYAMKIIEKKTFSISKACLSKNEMSEVDILMKLDHPCIIKIIDVVDEEDALYIILELVEGGELFDRVVRIGQFKEHESKLIAYQIILAIKYLHENGITHRDLKPENILLSSEKNDTLIKVTDFGLSKFVDSTTMLKTFCGTPNYLAPEIILTNGGGAYTSAIDVWSVGVIIFICLVGYPPFSEERQDASLREQIIKGLVEYPDEHWKNISSGAKDLVKRMLTVDPAKRISITEAANHSWFDDPVMKAKVEALMADQPDENGIAPTGLPIVRKRPADSSEHTMSPPPSKQSS